MYKTNTTHIGIKKTTEVCKKKKKNSKEDWMIK